jgi:hypothetical protein
MVYYANCSEAYGAGQSNMKKGVHPGYRTGLDRDNDGVACDNPPEDFIPKPLPSTTTTTTATADPTLPVTGSGDGGALVGTGTALLLVGCAAVVAVRRKYAGKHR